MSLLSVFQLITSSSCTSIPLVYLSCRNPYESPYQTSLFDDLNKRDKEEKIDKVIDEINAKLGKQAVKKASLVNTDIKRKELL